MSASSAVSSVAVGVGAGGDRVGIAAGGDHRRLDHVERRPARAAGPARCADRRRSSVDVPWRRSSTTGDAVAGGGVHADRRAMPSSPAPLAITAPAVLESLAVASVTARTCAGRRRPARSTPPVRRTRRGGDVGPDAWWWRRAGEVRRHRPPPSSPELEPHAPSAMPAATSIAAHATRATPLRIILIMLE